MPWSSSSAESQQSSYAQTPVDRDHSGSPIRDSSSHTHSVKERANRIVIWSVSGFIKEELIRVGVFRGNHGSSRQLRSSDLCYVPFLIGQVIMVSSSGS